MLKFFLMFAMTGGQVSFDMDALSQSESDQQKTTKARVQIELPVIYPSDEELNIHETWVKEFEKNMENLAFCKINF